MQLKNRKRRRARKPRDVRRALLAATCALAGTHTAARADQGDWSVDSAVLFYNETDRVSALEPVIKARRDLGDEEYLDLKLVVDVLTGASPSGALPSPLPQTFTRPSGNDSYLVAPGEIPLDDTFHDTRVALSSAWSQYLGRLWRLDLGASVSSEYDFQSLGASAQLARDFNKRNTTLQFGLSLETDSIDPVGGVPVPFAPMVLPPPGADEPPEAAFAATRQGSSESKTVTDLLVGVTQVINRDWIAQLNFSYSSVSGYQSDPYKLLSVLDDTPGPGYGVPLYNVYERRPDSRSKQGVYLGTKYNLAGDVIDLSLRYTTDDWGIDSQTMDLRYRWALGEEAYLMPHFRYYRQSAADFYRQGLLAGEAVPEYASADYRLADLDGITLGLEYGMRLANGNPLSFRVERYTQSGSDTARVDIGAQQDYDAFPDLDAWIVQISYSFGD